jgi:hypothetical protein
MAQNKETRRVQFDFSPEAYAELGGLKTRINAKTKADVIRRSLDALGWVVSVIEKEKRIFVKDGDGTMHEVTFPLLIPKQVKPKRR